MQDLKDGQCSVSVRTDPPLSVAVSLLCPVALGKCLVVCTAIMSLVADCTHSHSPRQHLALHVVSLQVTAFAAGTMQAMSREWRGNVGQALNADGVAEGLRTFYLKADLIRQGVFLERNTYLICCSFNRPQDRGSQHASLELKSNWVESNMNILLDSTLGGELSSSR